MFDFEGQLSRLLAQQRAEAEQTVTSAASFATYEAFSKAFYEIDGSTVSSSTTGEQLSIDFANLTLLIDRWINELTYFVDDIRLQLQMFDPIPYEVIDQTNNLRFKVEFHIIRTYEDLKITLAAIETEFSNVAIAYKSLVERSFNDMLTFHNTYNDIEGDFSRFNHVSVYIHGIENRGDGFFSNMPEVSQAGDVVIHEKSSGAIDYSVVTQGANGLELSSHSEQTIKQTPEFEHADGRVHMIYETDVQNEHHQQTSNHLEERLIHLGLIQEDKQIHMHGHSYGGRRSWQLALDYPTYVESITTMDSTYGTDHIQGAANITEAVPSETHGAGASNSSAQLHIDRYGEMINNHMNTTGAEVTSAHPEVFNNLSEMYVGESPSATELTATVDEQPMMNICTVSTSQPAETSEGTFKSLLKGND